MVNKALEATKLTDLADKSVSSLSGGQRQRVWIAMVLAQGAETILLDEPTTYLDMSHQIEILDLLDELNESEETTIVMVLHDLNLACRYADHIVAIKDKQIAAQGKPKEVLTSGIIKKVFGIECEVIDNPVCNAPMCIPL